MLGSEVVDRSDITFRALGFAIYEQPRVANQSRSDVGALRQWSARHCATDVDHRDQRVSVRASYDRNLTLARPGPIRRTPCAAARPHERWIAQSIVRNFDRRHDHPHHRIGGFFRVSPSSRYRHRAASLGGAASSTREQGGRRRRRWCGSRNGGKIESSGRSARAPDCDSVTAAAAAG